jgi:hypothetical protein
MKRKLALLLAAVMAVTAFPMTALAASENSVTRQAVKAGDEVLLIEERSGLAASGTDWSRIGHFKIVLKEDVKAGDTFKVSLENAEFNFGKTDIAGVGSVSKTVSLADFANAEGVEIKTALPYSGKDLKALRNAFISEIKGEDIDVTDVTIVYNGGPVLDKDTTVADDLMITSTGDVTVKYNKANTEEKDEAIADFIAALLDKDIIINTEVPTSSTDAPTAAYLTNFRKDIMAEFASKDVEIEDVKIVFSDGSNSHNINKDETVLGSTTVATITSIKVSYTDNTPSAKSELLRDFEVEERILLDTKVPTVADLNEVGKLVKFSKDLLNELKSKGVTAVAVNYNDDVELKDSDSDTDTTQVTKVNSVKVTYTTSSSTGEIFTYDPAAGSYDKDSKVYTRTAASEVPYTLSIGSGLTTATVRISADANSGASIYIPIVVELVGDKDEYRIRVSDSGNTTISETSHVFASKADGKTKTYVKDTVTARSEFELKRIIIEEKKLGSIKDGSFYLKAPKGYEFKNTSVKVGIEPGLSGSVESSVTYDNRRDKTDHSVLLVSVKGIKPSTDVKGALYLENVVLIAEDEETIKAGDVNLKIENYGSSTIYTEESFKVATASDYTIELKRVKDTIPTLVSGRYEGSVKYDNKNKNFSGMTDNLDDEYHKAATVKVSEKIPAAWWSERTTKLTLPEDVTILKAEFDEIKNLVDASKNDLRTGTNGTTAYFYNTQKKVNRVIVDDNELTITNIKIANDDKNNLKKASFELDLWLGMAANFEGDIDLTLSGSAVEKSTNADYPKVTIAKAIKPVEVKVDKVSEVQVGYQYFTVSDFSITETAAGNLLKGREVRVSITDGISIDMEIAKGFVAKVTEGDLKISNVTTSSVLSTRPNANTKTEGQITFEIDRESDEASTISFSNVQVKVSRNVPYSNLSASDDRGIDLVVWGDAIAANYYQLAENDEDKLVNQNDLFTVPGVSAKYINVVTVANDASSEFKNTVKVTIGNPVIKINDQDFTMPVAAYVSTASNSTMVPVRFVANALGLADEAVKWDDANKTVTVDAGTRIVQFQIGNTNYLVNGVSVPMVSPDGLPVAAEITSERAFIPFRALGEAFNVTVGWDAATSTATYNAADKK